MRRSLLLLLAALPLAFASSALAADRKFDRQSVCRVPDIDLDYDTERFTAHVSLPVTGCASREEAEFVLSATIARLDNNWGRDLVDRSVVCGPDRPTASTEPANATPDESCELSVTLDHPEVENAQYDVDVSYPGVGGERTTSVFTFCTSDGKTASCEH